MTSISSGATYASHSPRDRLLTQLQSAVTAGTVKQTDQTALSSAIDDIGSALKASGPPAQSTTPTSMKDKVDSLIDQEVKDGKLTDDQATELKQVFADASKAMGHHRHAQGAESASATQSGGNDCDGDGDGSNGSAQTASTSGSTTGSDPLSKLIDFLQKLETTLSSTSAYNSNGTQTSGLTSALVNTSA
jgi:hypothetical protein